MAQHLTNDRKITAADLAQNKFLFIPDNNHDAIKIQEIAKSIGIEWSGARNNLFYLFEKTAKGIVFSDGQMFSVGSKGALYDKIGLADIDASLFPSVISVTADDLHFKNIIFTPRNVHEAVLVLRCLKELQCEWPDSSGPAKMERMINSGIVSQCGTIRSGYGFNTDFSDTTPLFREISALPEIPLPQSYVKIFNEQATLIKEQADIIREIRDYLKPADFSFGNK